MQLQPTHIDPYAHYLKPVKPLFELEDSGIVIYNFLISNEIVEKIITYSTLSMSKSRNYYLRHTNPQKYNLRNFRNIALVNKACAGYIQKNIRLCKKIIQAHAQKDDCSYQTILSLCYDMPIMNDIFNFHNDILNDILNETNIEITKNKFTHPLYMSDYEYITGTLFRSACIHNNSKLLDYMIKKQQTPISGHALHHCISFSDQYDSVQPVLDSLEVLLNNSPSLIEAPSGIFKLPILYTCLLEYPQYYTKYFTALHKHANLVEYLPQITHYLLQCGANKDFRIPSNISTEYHQIANYNALDIIKHLYIDSNESECNQMGQELLPILQNTKQIYPFNPINNN